jgi:CBS domain-containing protein
LTWRRPVTIDAASTVYDAARLFAEHGVGALVVTDEGRPVGMVTDRDVIVRGIARGKPTDGRIDDLMSTGLVALDADEDVEELYAVFNKHEFRRVPVVEHDEVVGLVSLDDALVSTIHRLDDLASVVGAQIAFPYRGNEPAPPATSTS